MSASLFSTTIASALRSWPPVTPSREAWYRLVYLRKTFLSGSRTPPLETLEMEYYLKLESLRACQGHLSKICEVWLEYNPHGRDSNIEWKHRKEQENEQKLLADIHAFEHKLGISVRWTEGSDEWKRIG